MKRAIAILLIACSAMSFTLLFTQWHGVVGSAFLGIVGLVLLVSSLKFLSAKSDYLELTRPGKLCRRRLEISACDPPRKTLPQEIGNFGLRGSISARLAGTIAVNVTQVMVSSKWLETGP